MHDAHLLEAALKANASVMQAYRESVRVLAQVLLPQVRARTQSLLELPVLFRQHPDAFMFESLPNAGVLLAPALLVKFGDARARFTTAAAVQALAGSCPLTKHNGKRKLILFRRGCDLEFRRIGLGQRILERNPSALSLRFARVPCAGEPLASDYLEALAAASAVR